MTSSTKNTLRQRLALALTLPIAVAACSQTITPTTDPVGGDELATAAPTLTPAPPPPSPSPDASPLPDPTPGPTTQPAPQPTFEPTTEPTPAPSSSGPPAPAADAQPAAWPASGAGAATPGDAAARFLREVRGVPPVLGEVQLGDGRSAEVEVFSPGDGEGSRQVLRSTLLLRQLGPDDGWYVLAGVSDGIRVEQPAQGDTIPAGVVAVTGHGRGYEATIHVTAYVAGDPTPVAQALTHGSSDATLLPFSATLDLSRLAPGTPVTIVVSGDTGLETDPGEHAVLAAVIAG